MNGRAKIGTLVIAGLLMGAWPIVGLCEANERRCCPAEAGISAVCCCPNQVTAPAPMASTAEARAGMATPASLIAPVPPVPTTAHVAVAEMVCVAAPPTAPPHVLRI